MRLTDDRMTERMKEFLVKHREELQQGDDETINRMGEQFHRDLEEEKKHPSTAEDYVVLADEAEDIGEKRKYVEKALQLEPDNLDALTLMETLNADGPVDFLLRIQKLVAQANRKFLAKEYLEEYMGEFWKLLETRPYMRLREVYVGLLIAHGMMRRASEECEEIMRLNRSDNLGMRFVLMHLYVYLEEEEKAVEFCQKNVQPPADAMLLLPLAVLYYKKEDYKKALMVLKRLQRHNPNTFKFISAIHKKTLSKDIVERSEFGFEPASIEELVAVYREHKFLYAAVPCFFSWAYGAMNELRSKKTGKKSQ